MNKEQLIKEISKYGDMTGVKIRFYKVSPYRKRRYKPEFVGWEAWLYNGKSEHGYLITQEDWNNLENRNVVVKSFLS